MPASWKDSQRPALQRTYWFASCKRWRKSIEMWSLHHASYHDISTGPFSQARASILSQTGKQTSPYPFRIVHYSPRLKLAPHKENSPTHSRQCNDCFTLGLLWCRVISYLFNLFKFLDVNTQLVNYQCRTQYFTEIFINWKEKKSKSKANSKSNAMVAFFFD